jgi:hypothetical protein
LLIVEKATGLLSRRFSTHYSLKISHSSRYGRNAPLHIQLSRAHGMMPNNDVDLEDAVKETSENSPISRSDAVRKMLQREENAMYSDEMTAEQRNRRELIINLAAGGLLVACGVASAQLFLANVYTPSGFRRLPSTQFIAALGDPQASQGQFDPTGNDSWGLWRNDPGPRGVWLRDYDQVLGFDSSELQSPLSRSDSQLPVAPAGWALDKNDWWLEEHGILMERPEFPLPPGRYLVTGGRTVTTGLTVESTGKWKLDEGSLYDVTHLPCRSARYQPISPTGSPKAANLNDFPVRPGAVMPEVPGCTKQDYAVLFLVGVANGNQANPLFVCSSQCRFDVLLVKTFLPGNGISLL